MWCQGEPYCLLQLNAVEARRHAEGSGWQEECCCADVNALACVCVCPVPELHQQGNRTPHLTFAQGFNPAGLHLRLHSASQQTCHNSPTSAAATNATCTILLHRMQCNLVSAQFTVRNHPSKWFLMHTSGHVCTLKHHCRGWWYSYCALKRSQHTNDSAVNMCSTHMQHQKHCKATTTTAAAGKQWGA